MFKLPVYSTDFIIPLTYTGAGSGVATLKLTVSATTTMTGSGNIKFYTDSGGTLNEATSMSVATGAERTFYMRCASGTGNLTIAEGLLILTSIGGWTSVTNAPSIIGLNLSTLPFVLTKLALTGLNTVTGDLSTLRAGLTYISLSGSSGVGNTVTGNLSSLTKCTGLAFISIQGSNTISGTLSSLPASVTSLTLEGSNTISGALSTLPSNNFTAITILGNNTVSGPLSGISAQSSLTYLSLRGSNTVSGDIASLPASVTSVNLQGSNTIDTYTSGHNFSNTMNTLYLWQSAGNGLDETEMDNLLIDLENGNAWNGGGRTCFLKGPNAPPGETGLTAKGLLEAKSVTVTVNV